MVIGLPERAEESSAAFLVLGQNRLGQLDFLEVRASNLVISNYDGTAGIGIDDIAQIRATLGRRVGVPPKVSQFAALPGRQKYRRRIHDCVPPGYTRDMRLGQTHIAQGGLDALAYNPPVPQPNLVDTGESVRCYAVSDTVDDKYPHAGKRQEGLSAPLFDERGRAHCQCGETASSRVCEHGAQADQGLAGSTFCHRGGRASFLPALNDTEDGQSLSGEWPALQLLQRRPNRITGRMEGRKLRQYFLAQFVAVCPQVG